MNIMIAFNREYMKYACIMLMSLKEHHKDILFSVYILHNELSDEDFQLMDDIIGSEGIELIPVFIPEGTVKDFQIGDWPEVNAYRMLATDLFAGSLERILYLDVDTLITGDVSEFYNTPFEDHYLVACEDFLPDEVRRQKCREFGRDESASLFNAGVLLFNVSKLASDGFYYEVYANIMKRYPNIKIEYPDQDMLNLLFCDKTKYVDRLKYNYSSWYYSMNEKEYFYDSPDELEKNCSIVHMIGGTKPWINISKAAVDDLWWEYAARTPFYWDMKIAHVETMLRREQKMNGIIDGKIKKINHGTAANQLLLDVEESLFQILEQEFRMIDGLSEVL